MVKFVDRIDATSEFQRAGKNKEIAVPLSGSD
jgi:hypothetical protein